MLDSKHFTQKVRELKKNNLFNEPHIIDSPISGKVKIKGKWYLNLASNNYLGLANDKRLVKAANITSRKYGVGPAAVRTISGTTKLHKKLESSLQKFKKVESVVTFQSGFTANLAVIPAITDKDTIIFSDELNHASIIDGCRLSRAQVVRYLHADMKDLEQKLIEYQQSENKLIITDGVFSMDGDIAPLDEIYELAKKYKAMTMVDDAHGEGVLGKNGRGIVDHFNLHNKIDIEIGTLSKAFGVVGGFAAGKKEVIEWLNQRARPLLFSSAMTIPDVAASIKAVSILSKSDKLIKKLWENGYYIKDKLSHAGFNVGKSRTPITPVIIGDEGKTQLFSKSLFKEKILTTPIIYPTVPLGTARIRIMPSASHSEKELKIAADKFFKIGKELRVI